MSMSRRLAVVATALGTVAAGLFSGATVSSANASSASTGAATQTVEVFVKRDHTVVMRPDPPGVRFRSALPAPLPAVQAPGHQGPRDINAAQQPTKALRGSRRTTLLARPNGR
jgi:hypothetical protein